MARAVVVLGSGGVLLLCAIAMVGNFLGGIIISAILLYTWSFIARTILFAYGEAYDVTYEQYQENLRQQGIDPTPKNVRETSRVLGSSEEFLGEETEYSPGDDDASRILADQQGFGLRIRVGGDESRSESSDFADFLRSTPF